MFLIRFGSDREDTTSLVESPINLVAEFTHELLILDLDCCCLCLEICALTEQCDVVWTAPSIRGLTDNQPTGLDVMEVEVEPSVFPEAAVSHLVVQIATPCQSQ